jgi:Uma2 family endonuclease
MAQTKLKQNTISVADYLAGEKHASVRHEFVNGRVFAMAGASRRHNTIKLNVSGALNASLPPPCRVYDGDVKLQVNAIGDERYYYPDVFVTCEAGQDDYTCFDAVLVVEVLSATTERADRYEKFRAYMAVPSLQEYVLVDQAGPVVEVFRRRVNWVVDVFGPGDSVTFELVGHTMTVEQIYRRAFD